MQTIMAVVVAIVQTAERVGISGVGSKARNVFFRSVPVLGGKRWDIVVHGEGEESG